MWSYYIYDLLFIAAKFLTATFHNRRNNSANISNFYFFTSDRDYGKRDGLIRYLE